MLHSLNNNEVRETLMPNKKRKPPEPEIKKTQTTYNKDEIESKSLWYHNILEYYAQQIYRQKIKNPEDRIEQLAQYKDDLIDYSHEINNYLHKITSNNPPPTKYGTKVNDSNRSLEKLKLQALFTRLNDVSNEDYRKIKSIIIMRLLQKIHTETQKAKLEYTYAKAFYIYDGVDEEGNKNQQRSRKTYFWGVPAKENKNDVTYFFEWLSYLLGGFAVIPIKNALKYVFEYLPNYIATYFENRAENAYNDPSRSISSAIDYAISSILYWPFKAIWLLGRAIFSPVSSAIAGARTGYHFGYALAGALGGGEIAKVVTGAFFGFLLGAPSLLIGIGATIVAIIAAPPSLIYLIGKIPFIGAQAAGGLTAASETLSGLRVVSNVFQANQMLVTGIAPTVAASTRTGAGLMALAQLTNLVKDGLHFIAGTFYAIFSRRRDTQPLEQEGSYLIVPDEQSQISASCSYVSIRKDIPFKKKEPEERTPTKNNNAPTLTFPQSTHQKNLKSVTSYSPPTLSR